MKKYAICQYFNEFQRLNTLTKITIIVSAQKILEKRKYCED